MCAFEHRDGAQTRLDGPWSWWWWSLDSTTFVFRCCVLEETTIKERRRRRWSFCVRVSFHQKIPDDDLRKTKRRRSRATHFSLLFEKKTLRNKRTNDKATSKNGPLGTFFSPTTTISLSKPDDFIGEEEEEEERISKTLERILRGREDPETTTRWVCEYNNRRHDGC